MSARALRAGILAVTTLVILGFGSQSLLRLWHMKQELEGLEREIEALRAETETMWGDVARLRSDPEAIERIAREELGLVKPGERVLKLPPSPNP